MLRAVLEAGIRPDLIVGCSVGALNGTFIAMRPEVEQAARLAEIWQGLSRADVFGPAGYRTLVRLARGRDHVYTPVALRRLIRRCCPLRDLADTMVPMHVVTTDLDHGAARWWSRGPAAQILEASACLPGLFPPVRLDGCRHVDGGVLDPVPVQRALALDAQTVYVFGDAEVLDPPSLRMRALEVLIRSFAISRYAPLPYPAAMARPGQQVIVLEAADTAGIDLRDFSHSSRLISESYDRCREQLARAA
jgi:NTE family protein